jgi:hypothetical protein
VPVPRYAVLRRDENNVCDDPNFFESEDTIRVHGTVFHKPFVEKPLSAEDHNVYIYFPSHAGGGCQQLFRKIGSLSSRYCDQSQVRKTGSYIYENFMPTEGTDVKVGCTVFHTLLKHAGKLREFNKKQNATRGPLFPYEKYTCFGTITCESHVIVPIPHVNHT